MKINKKKVQIICPLAGPNTEFNKFKEHKILIKFANKRFIEWVQISRPAMQRKKGLVKRKKFK